MVTIIVRMPPIVIGNVETYNSTLMIYKKQIDAHAKHKLRLEDKCMKACSLFEGKWTKAVKAKLKFYANYVQIEASYIVFMMIRTLESIAFKFEGNKHQAHDFMMQRRLYMPLVSQGTPTPLTSWNFSSPRYQWWNS